MERTPLPMDWWSKRSLEKLRQLFGQAQQQVRIATGFFSASAYDLVRQHLGETRLKIMVGYDERASHDLQRSLISEFLEDLSHWHDNRRLAIEQLVSKLRQGQLTLLEARTRRGDHGKVYLIDEAQVIVGSTNFTRNGLLENVEANTVQDDPQRVQYWSQLFEHYWQLPDSRDISQELLALLDAWLGLRDPYQVYMKSVEMLVGDVKPRTPRKEYRIPAHYQMVLVNRALGQLERYRGAMMVASTGLGKTVVATHIAYELARHNRIRNVLVFAPRPTKGEWERRLTSAGVAARVITLNQLDRRKAQDVEEALAMVDEDYLIVIDESHYLRNRENRWGQRHAFEQLIRVRQTGCRLLLLTATPYSTDVQNVNHQLSLLPRTAPAQGGMLSLHENYQAWTIDDLEELGQLEVATVLNTPTVARIFGQVDPNSGAEYILYPDGSRRYIPSVRLGRIPTPVIAERKMIDLLESGLLIHKAVKYRKVGGWRHHSDFVGSQASVAWASSPWALAEVLEGVIHDRFKVEYRSPADLRKATVQQVLQVIEAVDHTNDPKFFMLQKLVEYHLQQGQKLLIFCERLSTVAYLERGLKKVLGRRAAKRIASTVQHHPHKKRGYREVGSDAQDQLIRGFAPLANRNDHDSQPLEDLYDVFVTSDALAAGINLQDATVQISYDLAWGADTIIQRAGRILRLRPKPARIALYTFTPSSGVAQQAALSVSRVGKRTQLLQERMSDSASLSLMNPLAGHHEEIDRLSSLVGATVELHDLLPHHLEEPALKESSEIMLDLKLYLSQPQMGQLGEDFGSIMVRDNLSERLLYSLVRYQEKVIPLLFKPESGHLEEATPDQVLGYIRCEPDTPVAQIMPDELERERSRCIRQWCAQHGIDESQVAHICSMLLVGPHSEIGLLGT
jgi:hypothetical protein